MNYCIILPAHNEEVFLPDALTAIEKQSLLPQKVIIVNDNSTDTTEKIIDHYVQKNQIFQKVNIISSSLHLPGSKVVNAFNNGLAALTVPYDFIVKLDADIIVPSNYFQTITTIFKNNPKVGIAGGFAYEQDDKGNWVYTHPMNSDHVRGAFKAYTKTCFETIGGLRVSIGWDTVDELLAKYHGFTVYTEPSLQVKHLRSIGKAYNKNARLLQGKAMYVMRYGYIVSCIASLKMALKKRKLIVFFDNLKGYHAAQKSKVPFIVEPEEGQFIRKLRWKGIRKKITS